MDEKNPQQSPNYTTQQATSPPPVNTYVPPLGPEGPSPKYLPKKIVIALCGIVVLVIVFQLTMIARNPNNVTPTYPTAIPSVAQGPTEPAPNGASWQDYADQEIGMTFEYSTDWTALPITDGYTDQKGNEYGHGRVGLIAQKVFANGVYNPQHREIVRVYDWDNPKGLSLKDYDTSITFDSKSGATASSPRLYSPTTKPTQIAGLQGYHDPEANCDPFLCDQYIIPKGKKFIEIKFLKNLNDPNYPPDQSQKIFDHIIETMKLL